MSSWARFPMTSCWANENHAAMRALHSVSLCPKPYKMKLHTPNELKLSAPMSTRDCELRSLLTTSKQPTRSSANDIVGEKHVMNILHTMHTYVHRHVCMCVVMHAINRYTDTHTHTHFMHTFKLVCIYAHVHIHTLPVC